MNFTRLKKNVKKGVCAVAFCVRRTTAGSKSKYCSRCRDRKFAEAFPVQYTFNRLRQNAKNRDKEFDLTIEQFRDWCAQTNYIELKGRYKGGMTIDRIRSAEGYSLGNIQILLMEENSAKGNRDIQQEEEDLPF